MLSAIVLAPPGAGEDASKAPESIVRSLAVLVGAAVADLVRDAVIAGPAGVRLDRIADHAGCGLVAGYAPGLGFIDEATDWLAMRGRHDAAALRAEPENLAQRLLPTLAPAAGVLARRSDCLALSASDLPGIARKLRARTLRSRARRLV